MNNTFKAGGTCTCPSGDGSLRWPCPAHPPEAQPTTWGVLQIGATGSAYDPPDTRRAFTYAQQPGNVLALRLGAATVTAAGASAGDNIDRGLGLLKALQEAGFGVFQLDPAHAEAQAQGACPKCAGPGFKRAKCPNCGEGPWVGIDNGADDEKQVQGGGDVCVHHWHDYGQMNVSWCHKCEAKAVTGYEHNPFTAPPSAPVGVEAFESRLRGRAGPFTAQPGDRYVDADIALAVLREALAQQPAPSAPVGVERLVAAWEADIAAAGPLNKKDLSPARFVRDLRALAQQPAAEAQAQGGGEVITDADIAEWESERGNGMTSAVGEYTPAEFWLLLDEVKRLRTAPPSAPVGVIEAITEVRDFARSTLPGSGIASRLDAILVQQPTAVDGSMLGRALRTALTADLAQSAPVGVEAMVRRVLDFKPSWSGMSVRDYLIEGGMKHWSPGSYLRNDEKSKPYRIVEQALTAALATQPEGSDNGR